MRLIQLWQLFWDKSAGRTLTRLSVTRHLIAEAAALVIVDWLIEFAILARRHSLTLLWLLEKTCCCYMYSPPLPKRSL
jgi:hypothetical protein